MNPARLSALLALSVLVTAAACSSEGEDVAASDQAVAQYPKNGKCGGLDRVDLGPDATPKGVCIGLVADAKSAPDMKMPRGIVELPTGELIVAAMGSWDEKRGSIWMLTPKTANGATKYEAKKLISGVDRPNGLALGPDPLTPDGSRKRVYVGTPSAIFRFDPLKPEADGSFKMRNVIAGLPGDAEKGGHPLRQMVFDGNDVYVNVGSSSNLCKTNGAFPKPCPDEKKDRAGIRHYVLGGNDFMPQPIPIAGGGTAPYEMTARGLRNSMGLAIHPSSKVLLQVENARDALGPDLPHEELNVIEKGKHYGWPYCHDDNVPSPEYKPFDCSKFAPPVQLLPAHAAPLGLKYYTGSLFPAAYRNKLVVPYHGYDPKGHRVVLVDVDDRGVPTGKAPREIVRNWDATPEHPMGAPVDIIVGADGSMFLTEDKNQTVLRLFYDAAEGDGAPLAPKGAAASGPTNERALCDEVASSSHPLARIENDLLDTQCVACHTGLLNKCDMRGNRERLIAKRMVVPGDAAASELYLRIAGEGAFASRRMPLGGEHVDDDLVAAVKAWIDQGAKAP